MANKTFNEYYDNNDNIISPDYVESLTSNSTDTNNLIEIYKDAYYSGWAAKETFPIWRRGVCHRINQMRGTHYNMNTPDSTIVACIQKDRTNPDLEVDIKIPKALEKKFGLCD